MKRTDSVDFSSPDITGAQIATDYGMLLQEALNRILKNSYCSAGIACQASTGTEEYGLKLPDGDNLPAKMVSHEIPASVGERKPAPVVIGVLPIVVFTQAFPASAEDPDNTTAIPVSFSLFPNVPAAAIMPARESGPDFVSGQAHAP